MARKGRKSKHSVKIGWKEVKKSLLSILRWYWSLLCLLRYLNPLYYILKSSPTYELDGEIKIVYKPSLWQQLVETFCSEATIKRKLLEWLQDQIPTFRVWDFTTTWVDGMALCALIESVSPGACPRPDLLKPQHKINNCRLGLKLAQKHLAIPQTIITAEEMALPGPHTEDKMRHLVTVVRIAASRNHPMIDNDNRLRSGREQTTLRMADSCTAKGSGLVVGIVNKRCKFNLYTNPSESLNLEIVVEGPNGAYCKEKITSFANRRMSNFITSKDRKPSMRNLLIAKASARLLAGAKNLSSSSILNLAEGSKASLVKIPFDYQCVGEGHFLVSFIPRSAGTHKVFIKWHGSDIKGSPFSVNIAETIEKLNQASGGKIRQKKVNFNEEDEKKISNQEGQNQDTDQTVVMSPIPSSAAPVFHRSSTIHRSISSNSGIKLGTKLPKQATVTRRRVLKQIMTKGGQEIIIHEAPSSTPDSSRQNSTESLSPSRNTSQESVSSRTDSSLAKLSTSSSQDFNFDMNGEHFMQTYRTMKYDSSAKQMAASIMEEVMSKVFKKVSYVDQNLKVGKRNADMLTLGKSHSSGMLMLPTCDKNFKVSPFTSNVDSPHLVSGLQDDSPKLKRQALKTRQSTPALFSGTLSSYTLPGAKTTDAPTWQDRSLLHDFLQEARRKRENGASSSEFMTSSQDDSYTSQTETEDSDTSMTRSEKRVRRYSATWRNERTSIDGKLMPPGRVPSNVYTYGDEDRGMMASESKRDHPNVTVRTQMKNPKACIVHGKTKEDKTKSEKIIRKNSVKKTYSDPYSVQSSDSDTKYLTRSNTTPESMNDEVFMTDSDTDPHLKLLQSESFKKSCTYLSHKAIEQESLKSQNSETFDKLSDHVSLVKKVPSTWYHRSQSDSGESSVSKDDSYKLDRPMLGQMLANKLRLSISMPSLASTNWTAFELNQEEESTLNVEGMQSLTQSAQQRQRCMSLEASQLSDSLKSFQHYESVKSGVTSVATDENETHNTCDVQKTPAPHTDTRHSSRRGSLIRQEVVGLCKVSEEDSQETSTDASRFSNESSFENDHQEKENLHPIIPSFSLNDGCPTERFDLVSSDNMADKNVKELKNDLHIPLREIKTPPPVSLLHPKAKVSRCTQVSYQEIKDATGWTRPVMYLRPRKRYVKVGENHTNGVTPNQDIVMRNNNQNDTEMGRRILVSLSNNIPGNNQENENERWENNSSCVSSNHSSNISQSVSCVSQTVPQIIHPGDQGPPRQSTVETIDSGIADDNMSQPSKFGSSTSVVTSSDNDGTLVKPGFINGHRAVARKPYRGRIALDPKLVSSTEDDREKHRLLLQYSRSLSDPKKGKRRLLSNEESASLSDSDNKGLAKKYGFKNRLSYKRKIMFSGKVMMYRRSSSGRSSRNSSKLSGDSMSSSKLSFQSKEDSIQEDFQKPSIEIQDEIIEYLVNESNKTEHGKETEGNTNKWSDSSSEWEDVGSSEYSDICSNDNHFNANNESDAPSHPKLASPNCSLQTLSVSDSFQEGQGHGFNSMHSSTEGDYFGFGLKPDDRKDLLNELSAFSTLTTTSPNTADASEGTDLCGQQDTLSGSTERGYLAESEDNNISPFRDISTQGADNQFVETIIENDPNNYSDILDFPTDSQEQNETELPSIEDLIAEVDDACNIDLDLDSDHDPSVPKPTMCEAFGSGLNYGQVGISNNFQVKTDGAGNGSLTVAISGPKPHSVTETNVTYTGDNLYEVIYEVTKPGYYVINVKWVDVHIPNSPVICKVAY